jgi:NADH-quinone oxidoreductase subunit E
MSVRRLAEDTVQPVEFKFNRANASWAKKKIKDFPKGREASAVIPLLMRAQEQDGWVTRASIEHMADMLDMPYIRVLEVATFYTQFQLKPVGSKAHIQVCGTTPCMLRGSEALMKVCKNKINHEQFETNEAGTLSWEEVECLGSCVNAPMIMVFKDTYEDLSPERLEEIIDLFEAGKGNDVPVGTQIDRINCAPVGGLTALTSDPNVKKSTAKKRKSSKAASLVSSAKPAAKKMAAAPKAVPVKAAKKTVAKKTAKPQTVASLDDKNRPKGITKPAKIDDLKLISGIGPKIESVLHQLGIYKFEQVGKWKKAERDWVDGYLRFKGRIERDNWVKQAKALAKGGRDEYVKQFGKEPR